MGKLVKPGVESHRMFGVTRPQVVDLVNADPHDRDLPWLRAALQSALEIEFTLIPMYLNGMWSIKTQSGGVFDLIKGVVREEMLHLGLVANMIVSVGGVPEFTVPTYPGRLPGGVLPDVEVYLAGLSRETVAMWMAVEEPEDPLTTGAGGAPTIGTLYDEIAATFTALAPTLATEGQLTRSWHAPSPDGSGAKISERLTALASVEDVTAAIKLIKDQGEGAAISPNAEEFGVELAHYYRFGEILAGKKLVQANGVWGYIGDSLPLPECWPVAKIPAGGYSGLAATRAFNEQFSQVVEGLRDAWERGDDAALGEAVEIMGDLYWDAVPIMMTKLSSGAGCYGPDWLVVK